MILWERPLFAYVLWVFLFKYLYSGAFEIHLWRILGIFMFGSNRPIFLISSKSLFSKYVSSCTICRALSYENRRPVIIVRVSWTSWILKKKVLLLILSKSSPLVPLVRKRSNSQEKKMSLENTCYSLVTSLNKTGHFVHWI